MFNLLICFLSPYTNYCACIVCANSDIIMIWLTDSEVGYLQQGLRLALMILDILQDCTCCVEFLPCPPISYQCLQLALLGAPI